MKSIPRVDKEVLSDDYQATYFCGAGFAFRRQAFLDLGMFWEPLVYGGQELDLSYRALDAGYRILQSQNIQVLHKSVPTARPAGQWVYYNARDRWWIAVRNLPWIYVVTTAVSWWLYTAWLGLRRGQLGYFFRGFVAGLGGFRQALAGRRPIQAETLRQVAELSGRVYY
jgi:GT2 family glycosyltransferase